MSDRAPINPHDGTHESVCVRETRACWAEFAASLGCLVLGLICVLAGASADTSAIGPNAGRPDKEPPAPGAKAATFLGVAFLLAGASLMVIFGVHFSVVKRRLDRAKLSRFARLGVRPHSRYSALPPEVAEPPAGAAAAAAADKPSGGLGINVVSAPVDVDAKLPPPAAVAVPAARPTGSGFYNLGFTGGWEDSRPPAEAVTERRPSSVATSGIGSGESPGSSIAMSVYLVPAAQPQVRPQQQQPPPPPLPHRSKYSPYRSSQI